MVPVVKQVTTRSSAPMDTLMALRSRKSTTAAEMIQTSASPGITELNILRTRLKASEMANSQLQGAQTQLRNDFAKADITIKQLQLALEQIKTEVLEPSVSKDIDALKTEMKALKDRQHMVTEDFIKTMVDTAIHRSHDKTTKLEEKFESDATERHDLRERQDRLERRVAEYEDMLKKQSIQSDEKMKSIVKEQAYLSNKHTRVLAQAASPTVKPEDFRELQRVVDDCSEAKAQFAGDIRSLHMGMSSLSKRIEQAEGELGINVQTHTASHPERSLKERIATLENESIESHKDIKQLQDVVRDTETKIKVLESRPPGSNGLQAGFEQIQRDFEKMEEEIHKLGVMINTNEGSFIRIFTDRFEPFERLTEAKLKSQEQNLQQQMDSLDKLQSQLQLLRSLPLQDSGTTVQRLTDLDSAIQDVRSTFVTITRHSEDLQAARQVVANEQQQQKLAIDAVKFAIRGLNDQYNNIDTTDLYKKMVGWIVERYPAPSTGMLQQLEAIEHRLQQMQGFTDALTKIPNGAQSLLALVEEGAQKRPVSKQLDNLAQAAEASGKSLKELTAKVDLVIRQRTEMQDKLNSTINERFEELGPDTLNSLQAAVTSIQGEVNGIQKILNEPAFQELEKMLPHQVITIAELQRFVESLNQNMLKPKGLLNPKWTIDYGETFGVPFPGVIDEE